MDSQFKIVTGPENHTGVAIFTFAGYAVHVSPNQNGEPSSIRVYPTDKLGCIELKRLAFGPVSATLQNLCHARAFILHNNAGGKGTPGPDGEIMDVDPDETGIHRTITDHVDRLGLPLPSKV